jgi:hypothetical protein
MESPGGSSAWILQFNWIHRTGFGWIRILIGDPLATGGELLLRAGLIRAAKPDSGGILS